MYEALESLRNEERQAERDKDYSRREEENERPMTDGEKEIARGLDEFFEEIERMCTYGDKPAICECVNCQEKLCEICGYSVEGKRYCNECYTEKYEL